MKNISTFSRVDPTHLLDGLFVPTVGKGLALYNVTADYDGGTISFEGVQLGATHQSILLAVAARTARGGAANLIVKGTSDDLHARQTELISAGGDAVNLNVTQVEASAYALLVDADIGDGGSAYLKLVKFLHQMSTISMLRTTGEGKARRDANSHLLAFDSKEALGGQFTITLNWRMAKAIFGKQHARISLHERRELSDSPVAKILHSWLSCYVPSNGSLANGQGATMPHMIQHVYGKRPVNDRQLVRQEAEIRAALKLIDQRLDNWGTDIQRGRKGHPAIAHVTRKNNVINIDEDIFDMLPGDIAGDAHDLFDEN